MEYRNSLSTISSEIDEMKLRKISQANILKSHLDNRKNKQRNFLRQWKRGVSPPRGWPIKYLTWGKMGLKLTEIYENNNQHRHN